MAEQDTDPGVVEGMAFQIILQKLVIVERAMQAIPPLLKKIVDQLEAQSKQTEAEVATYDGLLTAFPKMDIRSAHELSMIKEALFLSERESVFPDPASPSHTARRRPPPAGGDTAPISRRC